MGVGGRGPPLHPDDPGRRRLSPLPVFGFLVAVVAGADQVVQLQRQLRVVLHGLDVVDLRGVPGAVLPQAKPAEPVVPLERQLPQPPPCGPVV